MADLKFMDAVERPFQDFRKLTIGAMTFFIPVINFVTGFFGWGYALGLANKPGELPEWKKWGSLFKKGLFVLIISILYAVPFTILGMASFFIAGAGGIAGMHMDSPIAALASMGPAFGFAVLIGLALVYLLPAAIVNYSQRFEFSDAFEFGTIFSKAFTVTYFKAWLFNLFYGIVVGIASGILQALTSVTVVLPLAIMGYSAMITLITSMDIYGQVWQA